MSIVVGQLRECISLATFYSFMKSPRSAFSATQARKRSASAPLSVSDSSWRTPTMLAGEMQGNSVFFNLNRKLKSRYMAALFQRPIRFRGGGCFFRSEQNCEVPCRSSTTLLRTSVPSAPIMATRNASDGGVVCSRASVTRENGPSGYSSSVMKERERATSNKNQLNSKGTRVIAIDEQFIKSEPDKRQYRSILLANNLQVLLVSDPNTDVEAGSVHLQTGHFDDPVHRPGLAHFHEHMLFLGTLKYPEENDFEDFLNKNGGSSNAYTDMEDVRFCL